MQPNPGGGAAGAGMGQAAQAFVTQLNSMVAAVSPAVPALAGLSTGASNFGTELTKLLGGMAASGSSLQSMGSAAIGMVPVLGELKAGFDVVKATIDEFVSTVTKYVSAFSPAEVVVFNRAMKDLQGVIGYELQPVMQLLTKMVRDIADSLMTDSNNVRASIQDAVNSISKSWKDMQPTVDLLTNGFGALVKEVANTTEVFALIAKYTQGLLPLLLQRDKPRDSSAGMGSFQGQVTDPMAAFRQMQEMALQSGGKGPVTEDNAQKRHDQLMKELGITNKTILDIMKVTDWIFRHCSGGLIDAEALDAVALKFAKAFWQIMGRR